MPLMTPVRTIALSNAAVVSWVTMDSHAKIINVVGAAIVRDGAVLCAQRGPGKSLAGYWEFPGGKEELLCEIKVADEVCTSEYAYDFGTVRLITFICHLIDGMPRLTEHTDIRWLDPSAMPQLNWAPVDRTAVGIIAGMRFLTQTTSDTSEEPSRS